MCARALRQERAGRAGEPEGESLDSALSGSSPISQACAALAPVQLFVLRGRTWSCFLIALYLALLRNL